MNYNDLTHKEKVGLFNAIARGNSEYNGFTIRQLESEELQRDYNCYHVSGRGFEFVLKDSDIHELRIYQMLNNKKIRPRLSVPKMYEAFPDHTNPSRYMIAMEYINQTTAGRVDKRLEDGIIAYDGGTNLEAWRSAGCELARIHTTFWGVSRVATSFDYKNTFNGILESFDHSRLIQDNIAIKKAVELMKCRLQSMPITLVHFDLFPTNVLIKERSFSSSNGSVLHPKAALIDWQTAASLPYILDLARITSHCKREVVYNKEDLLESPSYCNRECQEEVICAYYQGIKDYLNKPKDQFMIDYLYGQFFELLRMYYQMQHFPPCSSYDRYYFNEVKKASDQIVSL